MMICTSFKISLNSFPFLELFYARQAVVTAAKAFRMQAIDCVYIDYKVSFIESEAFLKLGLVRPYQIAIIVNLGMLELSYRF